MSTLAPRSWVRKLTEFMAGATAMYFFLRSIEPSVSQARITDVSYIGMSGSLVKRRDEEHYKVVRHAVDDLTHQLVHITWHLLRKRVQPWRGCLHLELPDY